MFDKFNQLKKLGELKKQGEVIQKEVEKIIKTVEKRGYIVSVTGDQRIRYIKKDGEDMKELVDIINDALKDVQKESLKKTIEMSGGLSGLLGGLK